MIRRVAALPGVALTALAVSACVSPQATELPQRRTVAAAVTPMAQTGPAFTAVSPGRIARSNASVAADFLDLTFRMESGREIPQFSRFEGPVRVAVVGTVPGSAPAEIATLLGRLRAEAGIDITQTGDAHSAQIIVEFLPRARMQAVVPHAACFVVPRVAGWDEFRSARGTDRIDWTTLVVRQRATIFIPSDVSPQETRDCLHEELAQAIGPLNDLYHLSDSVFNDDNFNSTLTAFDMLVLRAIHAPELRSGMTRHEVAAHLPAVLARINPAGGKAAVGPGIHTPRPWITAVEAAMAPRSSDSTRRTAAARAVEIARNEGWTDNRRAFSHFLLGRLSMANQVEQAVMHFAEAAGYYSRLPGGDLHMAHVDMQMGAFALSSGQFDEVLRMTDRAIPAVSRAQNAAVLGTLLMLRAEALDRLGRTSEAVATRLDSARWARYGFGSEAQVRARQAEVSALAPRRVASRN